LKKRSDRCDRCDRFFSFSCRKYVELYQKKTIANDLKRLRDANFVVDHADARRACSLWALAATLATNLSTQISEKTKERRFRELFGINAEICAKLWLLCLPLLPESASPVHLLWALYFLRQYSIEGINASFAKCDEKTFRKWCWIMIGVLASLELVCLHSPFVHFKCCTLLVPFGLCVGKYVYFIYDVNSSHCLLDMSQMEWENRYRGDNGSHCLVSVDGTDFGIYEPSPFSPKWYSHKLNGPGLRYEIAICIQTGEPVWINGPFPCGSWPDLRIARNALVDALDAGEYYLADG
jgi:hypothetical protein